MENIGACVATARKNAGLSQKELSRRSGIDQSSISKYERNVWLPSLWTLEKLAEGMGMAAEVSFVVK